MITETQDMTAVNAILTHPDIWKDIAPEGVEPFDTPHVPELIYHLVNDGDGVIVYHEFRDGLKIHPNMLRRGKMAYQAVEDSIQMMFAQGVTTIYGEIDAKLKHVIRFAKALKFKSTEQGGSILLKRTVQGG